MGSLEESSPVYRRFIAICAVGAGAVGLLVLLSWALGAWRVGALGRNYIPMAPSTAILFVVLAAGLLGVGCGRSRPWSRVLALTAVLCAAAMVLLVWAQLLFGLDIPVERWLAATGETVGGVPVGLMSPLTAATFLSAALALLFQAPPFGRSLSWRQAASALALATSGIGLVVLLTYVVGTPVFYGGQVVPMALPTAVSFVLLGLGMLTSAGSDTWLLSLIAARSRVPPPLSSARLSRSPLIVLLPLCVLCWSAMSFYVDRQIAKSRGRVENELARIADLKSHEISRWYEDSLRDARIFLTAPLLRSEAMQVLAEPGHPGVERDLLVWMEILKRLCDYRIVALCDASGSVREATSSDGVLRNLAGHPGFERAVAAEDGPIVDFHRDPAVSSEAGRAVCLDIWIPIRPEAVADGKAMGAWFVAIDPYRFLYESIQTWPTPSQTAETVLLGRDGNNILCLNDLRHRRDAALLLRLPPDRKRSPEAEAVLGHEGVMEGVDYRDTPVLAAMRKVAGTPWSIVAKVDRDEVYAPVRKQSRAMAIVLLAMVLVTVLIAALLQRDRDRRWLRRHLAAEREHLALSVRHEAILSAVPDIIAEVDVNTVYTWVNREAMEFFGEDVLGKKADYYFVGRQDTYEIVRPIFNGDPNLLYVESWQRRRDGEERLLAWWCRTLKDENGDVTGALSAARDITEIKRAVDALRENEERLSALSANLADGMVYQIDSGPDGLKRQFSYLSPAVERFHGLTVSAVQRDSTLLYDQLIETDRPRVVDEEARAFASKGRMAIDVRVRMPSGEMRWRRFVSSPRLGPGGTWLWDGIELDITDQKRAEQEKDRLRSQLNQAQKMESVGRLAGGVAHDFNNMLGVILGYADLILYETDPATPFFTEIVEIRKAAERSADLTRQLLAFARKQTVIPKVLDLNETVEGMLKMLRRLIGEDIDLAWLPGNKLGQIRMDPSQVDQILANLCLNARDAVGDAGKITIETGSASFDEAYCARHAGFLPGEFLMLAVSDNGCGMDPETLSHLFEPFFTSKELGKGTGLGLATVYGIVGQNNGFIDVFSEPGRGTTFKIFLPAVSKTGPIPQHDTDGPVTACGQETILLVEDEPELLKMITKMLSHHGYNVLAAKTPGDAIHLASQHAGTIDLLMTDVIMPGMNGRDLAKTILSLCPEMRSLFMSGHTADLIAHHGVLHEGVNFIQKPFTMRDLAAKVREALDENPG